MIWQRISAQRTLAARNGGRWTIRRAPGRHERRSRPAHVPPVVFREPEADWWAAPADADEPGVTVAVVREWEAGPETEAVVAHLARLAVDDELLVVLGSGSYRRRGHDAVIAGLRGRLPRHDVVAVPFQRPGGDPGGAAAVERFLEAGSLPVVVTSAAAAHDVTAEISSYLRADRVLRTVRTTTGVDLDQVWRRHPEPSVN